MSRKIENGCVNCGLPCLHHLCKYYRMESAYCDQCGETAHFEYQGVDYCMECAEKFLQEVFNDDFNFQEKAEMVGVDFKDIYK